MKRLLKQKRGMTLMEILVALSLLMIIIVGTTPVMLQAYNSLYIAGEKTQETYEAKSEIEEMLATRNTRNVYPGFAVNFKNLGEVASLNGRRAVSSLYGSLETLFTNARVRVAIISSKTVNDDFSMNGKIWTQGTDNTAGAGWHEVVIQTTNLDFGTADKGEAQAKISINNEAEVVDGDENRTKIIDITFIIPDKSTDVLERVYTYKNNEDGTRLANVDYNNIVVDPITGRITVRINGFDFTQSPIKLYVSYLDENDKKQTTETYLFVDTPTIIAAGETGTYDYYTSPGFVQKTKSTVDASGNVIEKNVVESFGFYGRTMRTDNATSTQIIPNDTIFKAVNWITETTKNGEFVNGSYQPSYYVLTGTNGAIYRTYSMNTANKILGKVSFSVNDGEFGINGLMLNTLTGASQINEDVVGIKDKNIILDDKKATLVYPAFWGGDFSHIFGWSSYGEEAGYTERTNPVHQNGTWYTQHSSDGVVVNADGTKVAGIGSEGFYSNLAAFGYYYNGYALDTPYYSMNSRKISYILTEMPNSMRVGGYMGDTGSASNYGYDGQQFDRIWERPLTLDWNHSQRELNGENGTPDYCNDHKNFWGNYYSRYWLYAADGSNMPRSAIVKEEDGDDDYQETGRHYIPTYFVKDNDSGNKKRPDNGFAQLRIKALTTVSPTIVYSRGDRTDSGSDFRVAYDYNDNYSKITVTDAVYIPSTDSTKPGAMFYVGSVAAYGMINQVDNVGLDDGNPDVANIRNTKTSNTGRLTSYWVMSDDTSTSTTVYKHSTKDDNVDISHGDIRSRLMDANTRSSRYYGTTQTDLMNPIRANSTESHQFFISQPLQASGSSYEEKISGRVFNDVYFTLGYTSNREMVYTNIVYGRDENGNLMQSLKFCEPLYFLSHYGDENHNPNLYMNGETPDAADSWQITYNGETQDSLNSPHNDYYNVWFPGEMYNLIHMATKEGVTVSVGYAVSGSTYSYLNTQQNASTGLGGIFNDGVLASMVLGEDSAFENLLYYKDNLTFDGVSLSDGSVRFEQHGKSGENGSWVSYADIFPGLTYGTHVRDSVQFTAVDIGIQYTNISQDENNPQEKATYYAYYADNKGRVFRSKVATRNSSSTVAGTPVKVQYISDAIVSPGDSRLSSDTIGYMEQLTLPGSKQFVDLFDAITSLAVEGNMIFISGKPNQANKAEINAKGVPTVVGLIDENTGNIEWIINYSSSTVAADCWVEDLLVLDGYVYIAGRYVGTATSDRGFVAGVSIADLRSILMSRTTSIEHTVPLKCVNLPDAIYAIDGHK